MKNSDYENQITYQNALVIYCTLSSFLVVPVGMMKKIRNIEEYAH